MGACTQSPHSRCVNGQCRPDYPTRLLSHLGQLWRRRLHGRAVDLLHHRNHMVACSTSQQGQPCCRCLCWSRRRYYLNLVVVKAALLLLCFVSASACGAGPSLSTQADLLNWRGSGMSVMEMSHRGKAFMQIIEEAEADLRTLLAIPNNYRVLFLQVLMAHHTMAWCVCTPPRRFAFFVRHLYGLVANALRKAAALVGCRRQPVSRFPVCPSCQARTTS